jgi:tRNA(Ile)-lysidine synthase
MIARGEGRASSAPPRRAVHALVREVTSDTPLVVAFSGGLDSCVLLHMLRWGVDPGGEGSWKVVAAHYDHAMRDGSRADAEWAQGVCRAWGVPFVVERSTTPPASESEARAARYTFLDRVRTEFGDAAVVLTAHHADDQAETVLFRMFRGTGPDGLRGIHERRPGLVRPLLEVWREDLEAYAAEVGLRWREDPTNEHLGLARNALRHEILPLVEGSVASGARRALARLARLAEADRQAWSEVLPMVARLLDLQEGGSGEGDADRHLTVDRTSFLSLGRPLRGRVIRYLVTALGGALDEAAVLRVNDFVESSTSGRRIQMRRGATVGHDLDRIVFAGPHERLPSSSVRRAVVIERASAGRAKAVLGDRSVRVAWSTEEGPEDGVEGEASFDADELSMPLELRARAPGDRIRLQAGSRKVKKVLLEHRIPSARRDAVPVLVDAEGEVLWIPDIARSTLARPRPGAPSLRIRIDP